MKRKLYWGFAALIILIIGTAGVLFIQHNRAEMVLLEALSDADNSDSSQQQPAQRGVGSTDYKAPPLGETDDTGYWEGNTWHQKPAPKPKKKGWWKTGDTRKYLEMLAITGNIPKEFRPDSKAFARWIIAEHPYSQAALEARLVLGGWGTSYLMDALKYHPTSPLLHAKIAASTSSRRYPEKVVAFAKKKALRLLPTTTEDTSYRGIWNSPAVLSHESLGQAYQRLGDYKSALVHLKAAQRLYKTGIGDDDLNMDGYELMSKWIAGIEAGKPLIGPNPKPHPEPSADFPLSTSQPSAPVAPVDAAELPPVPFDFPASPSDDMFRAPNTSSLSPSDQGMREREAAKQAHSAFAKRQQQEFGDFLRWMARIEQAKSPADLEDFLMREMAKHLQGGASEFTPDRLIHAFEMVNRHGDAAGMVHLQALDPDIAKAMSRHPQSKRVPPRTAPVRPKTVHNPK